MRRLLLLVALLLAAWPARAQGSLADRVEDLRRTAAVRAALAEDAQTRRYDVGVTTGDGVVTLAGVVGTMGARERAEALAYEADGVRRVVNGLRLEGQPDTPTASPPSRDEASGGEPEEDAEEEAPHADEPEVEAADAAPAAEAPRAVHHAVRRGDTLYSIARRYGTTVQALQRLNDLPSPDIRVGQRLRVR